MSETPPNAGARELDLGLERAEARKTSFDTSTTPNILSFSLSAMASDQNVDGTLNLAVVSGREMNQVS